MGVFNKLKNVLFDIEEEDLPVISKEKKEPVREENPIKEVKMPQEDDEEETEPIIPVIKKEKSFNFPLDFDDELPARRKPDLFKDEDDDFMPRTSFRETRDYEEPVVKKKDSYEYSYDYSRINNIKETKKESNKPFKPSPVISPVYGVLDQNYTKDDVIVKSDSIKNPSLDDVRKKAYGAKKKKEEAEVQDEFAEPLRTLDEILIDREEETKKEEVIVKDEPITEEDPILDRNTPIEVYDDELPDEPYADEEIGEELPTKEVPDKDDALESDLFNLIDSMYEERNERDEIDG